MTFTFPQSQKALPTVTVGEVHLLSKGEFTSLGIWSQLNGELQVWKALVDVGGCNMNCVGMRSSPFVTGL